VKIGHHSCTTMQSHHG